jgi:hypothetical protein
MWVHKCFWKIKKEGEFWTLIKELTDNELNFYQYFRMSRYQFNNLQKKIHVDLLKKNTTLREAKYLYLYPVALRSLKNLDLPQDRFPFVSSPSLPSPATDSHHSEIFLHVIKWSNSDRPVVQPVVRSYTDWPTRLPGIYTASRNFWLVEDSPCRNGDVTNSISTLTPLSTVFFF